MDLAVILPFRQRSRSESDEALRLAVRAELEQSFSKTGISERTLRLNEQYHNITCRATRNSVQRRTSHAMRT